MLNKIGGRKVLFGLLFLTVGVTLAVVLGDLPSNLMEFMVFLSAGFFLGNGIEHGASALQNRQPYQVVDTSGLEQRMDIMQQQVSGAVRGVSTVSATLSAILDRTGIAKAPKKEPDEKPD